MEKCHDSGWPFFITTFALPLVEVFGGGATGWGRFRSPGGRSDYPVLLVRRVGLKPYDTIDLKNRKAKGKSAERNTADNQKQTTAYADVGFGTDMIANSALLAVNMYYFKYVLGRVDLVPITSVALTMTGVLSNLAIPFLTKKVGKRDYTGMEVFSPSSAGGTVCETSGSQRRIDRADHPV